MTSRLFSFVGGETGPWRITSTRAVAGEGIAQAARLAVVPDMSPETAASSGWVLRGITSNERYVVRSEKEQLLARQQGLGRAEATCAALIPIRKSQAWWALTQDERRAISSFYAERDRLIRHIWALFERYDIKVASISPYASRDAISRLRDAAPMLVSRPDVLVQHDAAVIEYLESPIVEAGVAKVLCTWDVAHERYNQNWSSYCVLTPVAITDLFAVVREPSSHRPIAQLVDFVKLQSDKALQLSAKIWDELVRIEKSGLADATLLKSARQFRQEYLRAQTGDVPVQDSVQRGWVKWKADHEQ
ncbi:MAG: hypothetical protein EOO23_07220 [Comamonadaceae bacterium]|nr:MAG: hypothetical protein EOO23_07220 [Comamonadaceae bacterium]